MFTQARTVRNCDFYFLFFTPGISFPVNMFVFTFCFILFEVRIRTPVVFFCTHFQFSLLFLMNLLDCSFSKDFCVVSINVDSYRINTCDMKLAGKHTENYNSIQCIFD